MENSKETQKTTLGRVIFFLSSVTFWGVAFVVSLAIFIFSLLMTLNKDQVTSSIADLQTAVSGQRGENVMTTDFAEIVSCMAKPWSELNTCYDEFVSAYGEGREIVEVLAGLEGARAESTEIENGCHPIAHAVGRLSLERYGNVGDAFQACDFTCHSGCYHGVMERLFFKDEEILSGSQHLGLSDLENRVPGICDRDQFENPTDSLIFQCLHGVGHAILYTVDYNLEEALLACDFLATGYERSSCYGGVIMENVTAFDRSKRDIDPEDYLYPCNKLEDKYQYSCYQMQTSIMFELGVTAAEMGELCLQAGSISNITACHTSIGRDLSNSVRSGDSGYVARICQQSGLGEDYIVDCVAGTIYALIDNTWDGGYAFQFCNTLEEINQAGCYESSLAYLDIYDYSEQAKEEQCSEYAGENEQLCFAMIL